MADALGKARTSFRTCLAADGCYVANRSSELYRTSRTPTQRGRSTARAALQLPQDTPARNDSFRSATCVLFGEQCLPSQFAYVDRVPLEVSGLSIVGFRS